ncbi:hypothetical protein PVK06_023241 [Gossypium arboreum]|uniref:Uncharacterized protein n=1 Tax=Gossypium arboreum TaxID=29729 RepID=A0ABR0PAV3_GOSAR|nr:hypothetical protein PVK06_023241 [Gossypium arboreum]
MEVGEVGNGDWTHWLLQISTRAWFPKPSLPWSPVLAHFLWELRDTTIEIGRENVQVYFREKNRCANALFRLGSSFNFLMLFVGCKLRTLIVCALRVNQTRCNWKIQETLENLSEAVKLKYSAFLILVLQLSRLDTLGKLFDTRCSKGGILEQIS